MQEQASAKVRKRNLEAVAASATAAGLLAVLAARARFVLQPALPNIVRRAGGTCAAVSRASGVGVPTQHRVAFGVAFVLRRLQRGAALVELGLVVAFGTAGSRRAFAAR